MLVQLEIVEMKELRPFIKQVRDRPDSSLIFAYIPTRLPSRLLKPSHASPPLTILASSSTQFRKLNTTGDGRLGKADLAIAELLGSATLTTRLGGTVKIDRETLKKKLANAKRGPRERRRSM